MKLHILTLNWNGADKLEKLYRGLVISDSSYCNGAQWYIKDNGSTDNSIETIKSFGIFQMDNISIFETGHNRDNFAQGMNFLFEKANPADDDLILLLNNDVEFGDDISLLKMHNLMKKTNAGIVGAKLLYPNTDLLQHASVFFSKNYGEMPYHRFHKEKDNAMASKNRFVQAVTAAVCLIKASSFRKIGGFDENLQWSFEDVLLNLQIGQTEKIAYCGETKIFHEESASLNLNPVNKMFLNHNVKYFKEKAAGLYKLDHDLYLKDPNYNVIP